MVRELQDDGFAVGRHRIARLMRENGLRARMRRRFRRTSDSHHAWPIAPNLLEQDFTADRPNRSGWPISPTHGPARAGSTSPSSSTPSPDASSDGQPATGYARNRRSRPSKGRSPSVDRHPASSPRRQGLAILLGGLPQRVAPARYPSLHARQSMPGKGNCYDNALAESFLKTLKAEVIRRTRVPVPPSSEPRHRSLDRWLLQPRPASLDARPRQTHRLRAGGSTMNHKPSTIIGQVQTAPATSSASSSRWSSILWMREWRLVRAAAGRGHSTRSGTLQ